MKVLIRLCIAAVLTLGATGVVAGGADGRAPHHVNRSDEHWCC
jgi:hypothetical protein